MPARQSASGAAGNAADGCPFSKQQVYVLWNQMQQRRTHLACLSPHTCISAAIALGPSPRHCRLSTGLFLIVRARCAYLSVLRVSSTASSALLTHAIMSVLLLPPSESCSSLVSLESLYGTCRGRRSPSLRALITLPSASRPCATAATRSSSSGDGGGSNMGTNTSFDMRHIQQRSRGTASARHPQLGAACRKAAQHSTAQRQPSPSTPG